MSEKKKRNAWKQSDLEAAVAAVRKGTLSTYKASESHNIPRRTLRDYLKSGKSKLDLGRKTVLTREQEQDFVKRIIRFADLGIPLTPKMIRKQVFVFCERYNIPNNFNKQGRLAGRDWLKLFLKRNGEVAKRKAQFLNQARGQKLNKAIVSHHFKEIKKLYDELGIHYNPERLYNMDEKGCRLTMHKQPTVITKKGAKRVHIQASEHGENVTVVGCANAVGQPIPPMVIFKGVRRNPEYEKNLPPGTIVRMAPKGSMTSELFIEFLRHFAKHKTAGNCLLVFDGAKCHLDFRIAEEADLLGITLYCLPSNTTHELQPLDKSCYMPFETYWDQEILQHFYNTHAQKLTRTEFNKILSKIWSKCMSHGNITSGFRATGLYPFNPDILPETAFAPSVLTEQQDPQTEDGVESRPSSPLAIGHEDLQGILSETSTIPSHKVDTPPHTMSENITENVPSMLAVSSERGLHRIKRLVSYSSSTDDTSCEDASDDAAAFNIIQPAVFTPPRIIVEQPDPVVSTTKPVSPNVTPPGVLTVGPTQELTLGSPIVRPSTSGLRPANNFSCSSTDVSDEEDVSDIMNRFITRPLIHRPALFSSGSDSETNPEDNVPLADLSGKSQFQLFMPTPNYAVTKKKPRRKALNYKGQRVTKDLFNDAKDFKKEKTQETKANNKNRKRKEGDENGKDDNTKKKRRTEEEQQYNRTKKSQERKGNDRRTKNRKKDEKFTKKGKENKRENWYCYACHEDRIADMRPCANCQKWYHEECVGLTKSDLEVFNCPGGCD